MPDFPTHPADSPEPDLGAARAAAARRGMLFGIPLGELGWFQSLLMGTAAGFAAFFLATFCAIVVGLFLVTGHHNVDFTLTYRVIGLPVGVAALAIAYLYLGQLWVRRKLHRP